MNRIQASFDKSKSAGKTAFVAYVSAGDPTFEQSLQVVDALVEAGIDILELGVPFSDPLADGEANQLAAARALENGTTPAKVNEQVAAIRAKYPELPIVLFTYLNPIAYSGDFAAFCSQAKEAGADAILPLDLPPEEAAEYRPVIDQAGLEVVSLIAPTTPEERLPMLTSTANAFVYYVSREGVTGEGDSFSADFTDRITAIRNHTELPIVVGFGISSPEHAKAAAGTGVDGIVVGSSIVRKVQALAEGTGSIADIKQFVSSLTQAI